MRATLVLAAALAASLSHAADVVSDFSTGRDGWTVAAVDPATVTPLAGGLPTATGGRLHATEILGGAFVFVAPAKFAGDKSAYLGGTVRYNLADETFNEPEYFNLLLVGAGLPIAYRTPAPSPSGTDYTIPLTSTGWVSLPSLAPVSDAQFRTVLASLDVVAINGDWTGDRGDGSPHTDVLSLGPVVMAVPEPAPLAALAFGLVGGLRRRRAA